MFTSAVVSHGTRVVGLLLLAVSLVAAYPANAGLIVDLDATTHAYSGPGAEALPLDLTPNWQGSENYAGIFGGGAVLDWAVFRTGDPNGDFQDFLDENSINHVDPSQPGDFVYAYQVNGITSGSNLTFVSIGKDSDEPISVAPTAVPVGDFEPANATDVTAPITSADDFTSATWQFNPVNSGATTVLYFASPTVPELDNGTVLLVDVFDRIGSPSVFPDPNPNEIPEPSSIMIVLLGTALAGIALKK